METPPKSLVRSKMIVVNAIIGLAALYPPAAHWVSEHAALTLQAIAVANILLRMVTHGRVSLFGADS